MEQGGLKAGDTVLVMGTGGVFIFALQLSKNHGRPSNRDFKELTRSSSAPVTWAPTRR